MNERKGRERKAFRQQGKKGQAGRRGRAIEAKPGIR
jgi:hypothetical protein